MTRFIIGTIAGLDYPLTPSEKGEMAFRCHMEGTTYEELQAERDAVLATTSGDIRWMSELISQILNQRIYCVYGNEDKLKENKGLFRELVVLQH
jgi:Zn-dependent M16 (insulinase) family peptidase